MMIYPPRKELKERAPARPLAGANMRLSTSWAGVSFSAPTGSRWRHPWFTQPRWDADARRWVATVKPGFVNGNAPVVQMTIAEARAAADQGYGKNPLSGEDYFSAWIFDHPKEAFPSFILDVPLYFSPALPLTFRGIGFDAPGSAVPQFFRDRGVNAAPPTLEDNLLSGAPENLDDAGPPKGNRLLRAADIILHQPRTGLTSNVSMEPGIVTGVSNVTQTLSLLSPSPADRLKVYCTSDFSEEQAAASGIDPLSGDFTEQTFDEIPVATVYLLSPPNTAPGTAPDATWTPFVQHNLFWDLNYAQPAFSPVSNTQNALGDLLGVATILGGGTAAIGINFATASINDAFQTALNILQGNSMTGSFWVPTGGGSTSRFPQTPPVPAQGATGLDKDGRLAAQRAAAAQARRSASLDGPFPYEAPAFPTAFLNS